MRPSELSFRSRISWLFHEDRWRQIMAPPLHSRNPVSTAQIAGHPLHPILITLPIGFFVATFLFDLVYWQSQNAAFATGAQWLLGGGIIGAALAAVAGLT